MNINDANLGMRIKVGVFTILGVLLIGAITVFVNDRPFWWRGCNLVHINVPDATGIKTKSPVRSLGIQIGYLKSIGLTEEYVRLGICITAPVEILENTKAYIRGEGFLGDKFLELKPVHYLGEQKNIRNDLFPKEIKVVSSLFDFFIPSASAEEAQAAPTTPAKKDIPLENSGKGAQQLIGEVNTLVGELTDLTKEIKGAKLQETISQLNKTLQSAEKTLSSDGGLTSTAQRTLQKLEDAISQLRDVVSRVNEGKGSVGKLLNDPIYAEEILSAIRNINSLLGKVSGMRFLVNVGADYINAYSGARSWFQVGIYPTYDRYYLLGITVDPRGKLTTVTTATTVGSTTSTSETTQIEQGGILLTGMLGKVFWRRLDLALGVLHGDGAVSASVYFGSFGEEERLQLRNDVYYRSNINANAKLIHFRTRAIWFPSQSPYLRSLYVSAGVETFRKVNNKFAYSVGAGLSFDDQDIKMLFSFL